MEAGSSLRAKKVDYRCPFCEKDLKTRKLSHAVISRAEIDCTYCKSRLSYNVHRLEFGMVMFNFAAVAVFIAAAYWLHSRVLAVIAFATAMAGALTLPVLERTWLRNWPRFVGAKPKKKDFDV